jgi:hypothetical protein
MKNPLQKLYPRYYSYFTILLMTKTMFNSELRGQGTYANGSLELEVTNFRERGDAEE